MGRQGVVVFHRSLRYRNQTVRLPDRSEVTFAVGEEKGVDIRMALDVIRMAHRGEYDVAVILSQDQDSQKSPTRSGSSRRNGAGGSRLRPHIPSAPRLETGVGINRTDWFPINRVMYDGCLDRREYRPPR